uniref:7TM_GPCR_Srx domain-containing protein n=1 Tax=Bursaphelenchus xylophilus TaxID=6326 RepID=A0A1I7SPT4_BURXY
MRVGGLFFINDNPFLEHASNATAMKFSALWMLGVYTAVMNIGFQFYHRYQVVVKSHLASKRQTFFSFALCLLACGVLCFTVLYTWIPSNENPEYAKELEDDVVVRGRKPAVFRGRS